MVVTVLIFVVTGDDIIVFFIPIVSSSDDVVDLVSIVVPKLAVVDDPEVTLPVDEVTLLERMAPDPEASLPEFSV